MNGTGMTAKERLDALEMIRRSTDQRLEARRTYEWKVAISLWTALAAFTAIVATGRIAVSGNALTIGISVLAVLVILLHAYFLTGISVAHRGDRLAEHALRREILAAVQPFKNEDVIDKSAGETWRRGFLQNYTQVFQVAVTTLLSLAAVVAVMLPQP